MSENAKVEKSHKVLEAVRVVEHLYPATGYSLSSDIICRAELVVVLEVNLKKVTSGMRHQAVG